MALRITSKEKHLSFKGDNFILLPIANDGNGNSQITSGGHSLTLAPFIGWNDRAAGQHHDSAEKRLEYWVFEESVPELMDLVLVSDGHTF